MEAARRTGAGKLAALHDAGAELGDLQERYDRLVEQAPDAILVHVSGLIVLANAAAVRLAGADSADQLIGSLITDFLVPPYLKAVEVQIIEEGISASDQAVTDSFRRVDGTVVPVEVTAIPFVDRGRQPSAHLVIRDMTERAKARESEQLASSRLRLLLNQLPALVWTTDLSLRITSMQGTRDVLLSVSLTEEPALVASQRRALKGESATVQTEVKGVWLEAHVEPLYDAVHAMVGCLGIVQDVTARKVMEANRNQAEKDATVGTLAGGVAHEVNNMMAVVLGFADLLLDSPLLPESHRTDVREIRRAAERATAITAQLLAFSRRGAFLPMVIRLDALLTDTVPLLHRLLGDTRPLQLRFDCPPSVRVDVGQFELVLVNLAINARDAMPTGGTFSMTVQCEDVGAGAVIAHNGEWVPAASYGVVRITDTGSGMTPDVLAHIFEPFYTTKPRGEGTGLGLAAVAGILDRNDIPFRVDSVPDQGTVFTLYMPIVADVLAPDSLPVPAETKRDPTAQTLLVVDDEPAVRAVICRSLAHLGYRVLEAAGGVAALELLQRHGAPDAVLLDLSMPGMDGAELAQRIASRWPELPILFMSGHTEEDVARLLAGFPGTELLRKPFDAATLVAKVRELVTREDT